MTMLRFPLPNEKMLPDEIPVVWPPVSEQNSEFLDRIRGSLVALAVGDALGASVEFRPQQYLAANPVREMMGGGTWGLQAGQWTDDTSMALCLASSLITKKTFDAYDQMVRYKWWYKYGYLSSTGQCFDIGKATRDSIEEFVRRQNILKRNLNLQSEYDVDRLSADILRQMKFNIYCSHEGVAGNGALMRLAPVPLFYYRRPALAVDLAGRSARLTHGDTVAVDACRYYAALIIAAIYGESKKEILSKDFYYRHQNWFGSQSLHQDILYIAHGSFKKPRGYQDGIRAKGHIGWTLEAALWGFWRTESFNEGALAVVNLGDDTDTVAAVYGQLAGAHYGYRGIPQKWIGQLYANKLIICIADWLEYLDSSSNQRHNQQRMVPIRNQFARPPGQHHLSNMTPSKELETSFDEEPQQQQQQQHSQKKRAKSASRQSTHKNHLLGCFGKQATEV